MKKHPFLILFLLATMASLELSSQNEILFTVDDLQVSKDEFTYVFEKNNGTSATEKEVKEYLDLYKKFKLKVKAALDKKMDTLPDLQEELRTYRRQLSKNYLLDKQLQENVARETYERQQTDRKIAHIVLTATTEEEEEKAQKALEELKKETVEDFEAIAAKYSEDPGTKDMGGVIGFLSAPFAEGFEKVEDLVYSLEIDEVGGPVQSDMGWHLIKVLDQRPARGRIQLSHIFVRKPKPGSTNQDKEKQRKKEKILSAYEALKSGSSFKNTCLKFSEDDKTKYNDGFLGFIEPNTYEEEIEEAVFALEEPGDYTQPVESSLGWHIFMRGELEKPQDKSFEEARSEILSALKYTRRLDIAQAALIEQIKKEAPFEETSNWAKDFREDLPQNFARYDWEIPEFKNPDTLFRFGSDLVKTRDDFMRFLKRSTRERLRLDRKMKSKEAFDKLYQDFVTEAAIQYEESQLEEKYSEFKHLMREYREGILLFEITKEKVWDKAPQDTAGLRSFYEENKENYRWNDRARLLHFELENGAEGECQETTSYLLRRGAQKTIKHVNKDSIKLTYTTEIIEKGKTNQAISWQERVIFDMKENPQTCTFSWIQEIIPSKVKSLDEARGYVISDYQNALERQWITELEDRYRVRTNKKVLKSVIESYQ